MLTFEYPTCRHRREPRARWAWFCRSPKVFGQRLVSPDVCRGCPFVDHHWAGDGTGPDPSVRPDMSAEALAALLEGPPQFWPSGWADWPVTHKAHRLAAEKFLGELPDYPVGRFRGRGAVIAGGGAAYFPSVYVTVRALRFVGWRDPIQVWYLGRENELPPSHQAILGRFGVECVDADAVRATHPCRILNGWELKAYAVLHSPFQEVLSLDADCYPVRDPAPVFAAPEYQAAGAVFWPDLPDAPPLDWLPFGVASPGRRSIESGQLAVDKSACWRPLQLAWWLNDHSDWSYLHGYGDKHTFEVAWAWCGRPYGRFREDPNWSAHSFLHAGPDGGLLFVHRCKDKFRLGDTGYFNPQAAAANCFHPELPMEAECFGWLHELAEVLGLPPPAAARVPCEPRAPTLRAFLYTCPERDEVASATLAHWRMTDWGEDPVVIRDDGIGLSSTTRHLSTARRMLATAAGEPADYYLLLEDDLLFNFHLRHNLQSWPPVRNGSLWMGSLYNPGLSLADGPADLWGVRRVRLAPGGYYGAQAVVLSRAAILAALNEWDVDPGLFDLKLAGSALRHSSGVELHVPSLVQHIPAPSTWGGVPHRALDFDPFYRA